MTRHTHTPDRRPVRAMFGLLGLALGALALALPGSARAAQSEGGELVVAVHNEDAALRLLAGAFEKESGVRVRIVEHEHAPPDALGAVVRGTKADVLWTRDVVGAGALAAAGTLAPHTSNAANGLDETLRDAGGRWFVAATRARVMAYNTKYPPKIDYGQGGEFALPSRIVDAWNPQLSRSQIVFAHSETPSMRAHIAAMRTIWDAYETRRWAFQVKRQLVRLVRDEQAALNTLINETATVAIVDSDVAATAKAAGEPIESIAVRHDRYDLRAELVSSHGPLLLPILVGRIEGGANTAHAAAFIDFVISSTAQGLLAGESALGVYAADGAGGPELPSRPSPRDLIEHADESLALFRMAIID